MIAIIMIQLLFLPPARSAPLLLTLELGQLAWQCRYRFFNAPALGSEGVYYLDGPWEKRDSWLVAGDLLPPKTPMAHLSMGHSWGFDDDLTGV